MKAAFRALSNDKNDFCEGERIVRELTAANDDIPEVQRMRELVYLITNQPDNYKRTHSMLMKRVTDYRYAKHMEKGLLVVEYLLKHADEGFVRSCKSNLSDFEKLKGYKYEMCGKEYGAQVRTRANRVVHYLTHNEELNAARNEALGLPSKNSQIETEKTKKKLKVKTIKKENEEDDNATLDSKSSEDESPKHTQKKEKKGSSSKKNKNKETTSNVHVDPFLNDFSPEDKHATTGTGEDGGQYTFGAFDEYDEPFDKK